MSRPKSGVPNINVIALGNARFRGFYCFASLAAYLRSQKVSVQTILPGADLLRCSFLRKISGRNSFSAAALTTKDELRNLYALSSVGTECILTHSAELPFDAPSDILIFQKLTKSITKSLFVLLDIEELDGYGLTLVLKALLNADYASDIIGIGCLIQSEDQLPVLHKKLKPLFDDSSRSFSVLAIVDDNTLLEELPPQGLTQAKGYQSVSRSVLQNIAKRVLPLIGPRLEEQLSFAHVVRTEDSTLGPSLPRRARIAVSDDPCFSLSFQSNLSLLAYYGAEIVPLSPVADSSMPSAIGAVYINGGSLFEYGQFLQQNMSFFAALEEFIEKGGILFSEGSGSAYCSKVFAQTEGESFNSFSLLPAKTTYIGQEAPIRSPEICTVEFLEDTVLGLNHDRISALHLADWRIEEQSQTLKTIRVMSESSSLREKKKDVLEGFSSTVQTFNTFLFLQYLSKPEVAKNFVDNAEIAQRRVQKNK